MALAKESLDPRVGEYIDGVLTGGIVAGRLVRMAVERHCRDLDRDESPYWFDVSEANFRIKFLECLHHSKGEWAGQPIKLEPWQAFLVAVLFGWKQQSDGARRFRTGYVELARKNGKSTIAAALGHSLFVADGEEGAEVYTAATKRDQAKIVHEEAKRMAKKSPLLNRSVKTCRDNLFHRATNSKYEPLGADADTQDGLNVSGAIVDEVHAHKTRELWDVLETATGSRRQPLILGITTAGSGGDKESICWELHQYSRKVLEGQVDDDSWFAFVAALDEAQLDANGTEIVPADDWTDERVWAKANPNLGVSVKLDDLRRKFKKAMETPAAQNNFRRKHLNQWTESTTAWLPAGLWESCAGGHWYGPHGLLEEIREKYRGRPCWVGGDLSSVNDLTGFVFAFPDDMGGVDVIPFAWCPRDNAIGRSRDRRVPYMTWSQRGVLFLTEGNSVDDEAPRRLILQARDEWGWDVREVAIDPYNAAHLLKRLGEDGFVAFEHRQGYLSMNEPIKTTQKAILDRKLRHGGHPVLAWCVSNVVVRPDPAENLKFDKAKSGDKIDLAVAMTMAVGRAILEMEAGESAYKTRGVLFASEV